MDEEMKWMKYMERISQYSESGSDDRETTSD